MNELKKLLLASAAVLAFATTAHADSTNPRQNSCSGLPSYSALQSALKTVVNYGPSTNGGLGFNMWVTVVGNDGTVCAVVFSGTTYTGQWLASRVISAQKANTANGLSLGNNAPPSGSLFPTGLALSTANLYSAVQPGGSLYGLQFSNPVDPTEAYFQKNGQPDDPATYGTPNDPMVGFPIGGVNVFGGGLALYQNGKKVGGLGVSGDTSCTDHFVAWGVRNLLHFDQLGTVKGVSGDSQRPDNIVFDIAATSPTPVQGNVGVSPSGWGHPRCVNGASLNPASLAAVH
jgi:Haem-degrading